MTYNPERARLSSRRRTDLLRASLILGTLLLITRAWLLHRGTPLQAVEKEQDPQIVSEKEITPEPEQKEGSGFHLDVQGYSVPNCHCIRFGFKLGDIKRAQRAARSGTSQPPDWFRRNYTFEGDSTCSDFATQRGANQRVVSFSYYSPEPVFDRENHHYKKYLGHMYGHIFDVEKQYPGWVMRIYHNVSQEEELLSKVFCRIHCGFPHVDLCDVRTLPGNVDLVNSGVVGRMWRFAVLGDPTVSTFLVRDTDSVLHDRMGAAVQEWLSSGRGFHVMRDHPNHHAVMLAGLWGGHNRDQRLLKKVREDIFTQPTNLTTKFDQYMLATKLWPVIKDDVLQHDSYNCLEHEGSVPFPTRRLEGMYCGWGAFKLKERKKVFDTMCPVECRPKQHLDWNNC